MFLGKMEQIMPWAELLAVVEPQYPKGKRETASWSGWSARAAGGLSNESLEDAITDTQAMQALVGIDLSRETTPALRTSVPRPAGRA